MPHSSHAKIISASPSSKNSTHIGLFDRCILLVLFSFLFVDVLQGPIRYYLYKINLPYLIYLPKILMVVTFPALALRSLALGRTTISLIILVAITSFFSAVGFETTKNLLQVGFGIFVLLPVAFSAVSAPVVTRHQERIYPFVLSLWVIVAVGVSANYFSELPWTGLTYQLEQMEVGASRQWSSYGIQRLAGFSRASFEAAGQLIFFGLTCAVLTRNIVLRWLVWILSGYLVILTTTKISIISFLALTPLIPLLIARKSIFGLRTRVKLVLPVAIALVGILMPLSSLLVSFNFGLDYHEYGYLLGSLEDRFLNTWPSAFKLITDYGTIYFGRGIGGIGASQKPFEPDIYNPADNIFIYFYAIFGFFSLYIAARILNATWIAARIPTRFGLLVWFWSIALLMGGWMSGSVESATASVVIGFLLAGRTQPQELVRSNISLTAKNI